MPDIYRVSITPADTGSRIMVRRRLTDGRDGYGDVVGDLISWSDGTLRIATRAGVVAVDDSTLVAGKRVPPAPPRRSAAADGGT